MGGSSIAPRVVDYLASFPGEVIVAQQICQDLDMDKDQVRKSMSHLLRTRPSMATVIEVVQSGNAWCWRGARPQTAQEPAPANFAEALSIAEEQINGRQPAHKPAPTAPPPPVEPATPPVRRSGRHRSPAVGDLIEVVGHDAEHQAIGRTADGRLFVAKPL